MNCQHGVPSVIYFSTNLNGKSTNASHVEGICSQYWIPFGEIIQLLLQFVPACFELIRRPQGNYFLPFLKRRGTITAGMLAIIRQSKNFDSQTALQRIFENGANAIATCWRGLQLARLNCQSNTNVEAEVCKVPIKRASGLTVKACLYLLTLPWQRHIRQLNYLSNRSQVSVGYITISITQLVD